MRTGDAYAVAAKGAPEAIADLCHLDEAGTQEVARRTGALAVEGLRVLGVACARFTPPRLPSEQHVFEFEFLGLAGLADPLRPGVAEAVADCQAAQMRVLMITGDHPVTAMSIAREAGLPSPERCVTERNKVSRLYAMRRNRATTSIPRGSLLIQGRSSSSKASSSV